MEDEEVGTGGGTEAAEPLEEDLGGEEKESRTVDRSGGGDGGAASVGVLAGARGEDEGRTREDARSGIALGEELGDLVPSCL